MRGIGVRPEIELVVACARRTLDAAPRDDLRARVGPGLDWSTALRFAARHGLQPLLATHLLECCADALPAGVAETLRRHLRNVAARNLRVSERLSRLLHALATAGVDAMPYKGPILAADLYGHVGLREFVDLDILVPQTALTTALTVVQRIGLEPFPAVPARHEAAFRTYHCEHVLLDPTTASKVEIQWAIAPRFFATPLDYDAIFRRSTSALFMGVPHRALATTDLLLILCIHAAKHHWERLEWFCAIAELLRRHAGEVDWDELVRNATTAGARRMASVSLQLARELFDAPMGGTAARWIASDPAVTRLADRTVRALLDESARDRGLLAATASHLAMRDRLSDRARYLTRLALTPTLGDWRALGAAPRFAYYPLRALRLLGKYALRPGREGPRAPTASEPGLARHPADSPPSR
jgi:hypothetical protein